MGDLPKARGFSATAFHRDMLQQVVGRLSIYFDHNHVVHFITHQLMVSSNSWLTYRLVILAISSLVDVTFFI